MLKYKTGQDKILATVDLEYDEATSLLNKKKKILFLILLCELKQVKTRWRLGLSLLGIGLEVLINKNKDCTVWNTSRRFESYPCHKTISNNIKTNERKNRIEYEAFYKCFTYSCDILFK